MRTDHEPASLTIRALEPDDGMDELFDLQCRAFGPMSAVDRPHWQAQRELDLRERRTLGAFDGPRLVAAGRFHHMVQWWCGRPVPMAGVASVAVAPEQRGRGVGRTLMTAMLGEIASRGYPLSALFPSTLPLYRSLGWEIAGTSQEAVIPAHALRSLAAADPAVPAAMTGRETTGREMTGREPAATTSQEPAGRESAGGGPREAGPRRAGADDAAEALDILGRVHREARDCGPNTRDEEVLRLALGSPGFYGYLADDGLLMYDWRHGHDEIFVRLCVAGSARTTRELWGIVGSHCWIADTVRAWIGPADPLWWLTGEPVADAVDHDDWMLRVVDPAAAIAARGFPPAARLAAWLRITDTARPANSGLWRLDIGDGRGSLTRHGELADGSAGGSAGASADGDVPLALGPRGLAALYAGIPVATLRRAGLAVGGDPASDALLDGAFAATPFMIDRF